MDGLELGLATGVTPVLEVEESVEAAAPFSWDDYPNLAARFTFTTLSSMFSSEAHDFDGSNYLEREAAAVSAYPMTMLCWFNTADTLGSLIWVGDKDALLDYQQLIVTSGKLAAQSYRNTGDNALSVGGATGSTWRFGCAVFTSATSRKVYLDDAAAVEKTTSIGITATYNRTSIGRTARSSPAEYFDGTIQNAMIFNVALSDAEVAYMQTNKPTYDQLVVQFAAGATNCPDPANIKAAWGMDHKDYVAIDVSGNGMHLTPGTGRDCAIFTGSNSEQLRNTASSPQTGMPLSMVCWFRSSNTGVLANLMSNEIATGADYYITYLLADDTFGAKKREAAVTTTASAVPGNYQDDNWHMGTGVFASSTSTKAYCDGAEGNLDTTEASPGSAAEFRIGAWNDSQYYTGRAQFAMIWPIALTKANHLWLYNYGKGRSPYEMANDPHPDNPGVPDHLWKLNEASGQNRVDTYGSYTLTDVNTVTSEDGYLTQGPDRVAGTVNATAGVEDRCLEFDGSSDYLTNVSANYRSSDSSGSISLWFRTSQTDRALIYLFDSGETASANNEFSVILTDGVPEVNRVIGGGAATATTFGSTDLRDGDWHHLVIVSSGTAYLAWVDGSSVAVSGNDDGQWFADVGSRGTQNLASSHQAAGLLQGRLDEVSIWSSQLAQADVDDLYVAGIGALSTVLDGSDQLNAKSCVGWWNLSANNVTGAGEDQVGSLDFTETGSPSNEPGIPAGHTVSGLVALVSDQTSNGNDLTQTSLYSRPEVVRVADSTGYGLKYDGVDDSLVSAAFAGALSQPNTIFLTMNITDNSADQVLVDGIAATSEQALQVNSTGDLLRIDGGTAASTTIGADYGTLHTILGVFNGASSAVYQDGGTGEVESAGAETMTGVSVGVIGGGSSEYAKGTYRQLAINDGALTTDELNEIGGKLATDHSLTWTDIA